MMYDVPDPMELTVDSAEPWMGRRALIPLAVLTGVIWAIPTGFASSLRDYVPPMVPQGIGLAVACLFITFMAPEWLRLVLGSREGKLILAFIGVSAASTWINHASMTALVRNALLFPAFGILYGVVRKTGIQPIRVGLTFGGLAFSLYHLVFMDFGSFADPLYRVSFFLNTNAVGFIAGVTALSLLEFSHAARRRRPNVSLMTDLPAITFFTLAMLCASLCLATKSRTANLSMLMGVLYLEWRYVNLKVLFLLSFIALIFAMMNTTAVSGFSQRVSTFFSFTDRGRGLDVGSGRYEALGIAIHDFWLPHFWLGIGPGQISVRGMTEYRNLSVDNAAIAYLSEVGILGAIPMFLLVVVVVKKAWMLRHDDRVIAATAILLANIVETGGESLLINMGNPGSLIFLWSIAAVMAVAAAQGEQVSAPELEFLPA